ncbi:ribosomal protein S6 kinase-like 1 isoform X1 [Triplophysa rosa]|uniref:ribosomal protein S6 kinase-like 1 isoform X1 n=1 Tax=Triplophysa rosa TaxID=992332 RepID=UPI002545ED04|nr:ribosomal protein S6 kinase-like 1 isoform X1 [Triplophysa rosa]
MAKRDYLVEAAQQIRMALDREVNEDYEAAFSYYKNGVDLLLNGVQVDPNKERREAVKRKTTQYLKRAEEIFISYLQDNITKGSTHVGGYSSLRFRSIRHLSSPVENLSMCRVLGVLDKVLTVEGVISGETFIVKSLSKSSWESRARSTVIPQGVPFMVKLLKYYVSEDSVFLHLEHVQGGRVFSRLRKVRLKTSVEYPDCSSPNQHKIPMKNSYTLPCLSREVNMNNSGSLRLYEPLASVGLANGLTSLPQENLPVHPCVIVDTRDPLDVTSDLLGNDVRIERMDWNALEAVTVSGSNSDVLGRNTTAPQVTLCSTVNVLPQRVRILPNTSQHERTVHHSKPAGNAQPSQFVAELSVVHSHHCPFQKQEVSAKSTPRVNARGDVCRRWGMENGNVLNPLYKPLQMDTIFSSSGNCTLTESGLKDAHGDGLCHEVNAKIRKARWKRDGRGLPEEEVRLWGAQILLALESLHEQGIICHDLNPRNILLRSNGEACLTYFGQWTEVQPEMNPSAVEEMYCAPEIGGVLKITEACDWWSLGAILYELLTGVPLWQCHPSGIHPHTPLYIPDTLSTAAASLLAELLQFDAGYRLGSGGGGVSDIKCHPFFNSVPWLTLAS